MKVSEIMASAVQKVDRKQSLQNVAGMMRDFDIGCVVVEEQGKLLGVLTDRDITCKAVASGKPLDQLTAADVMTPEPAWCGEDDTVRQAALIMERNKVRRLPVLDFNRKLTGIVSLGDVSLHAPYRLAAELVREVSRPEHRELAESA